LSFGDGCVLINTKDTCFREDYKMKKLVAIILALMLTATLLVGCYGITFPHDDTYRPDSSPLVTDPENPPSDPNDPGSANSVHTPGLFPFSFSVTDIHGNTVTEASMGEKDLFFVHYWGTWCGPCIREMPDIGNLMREFEDSVGFLMLLNDFDNASGAAGIYNEKNVPSLASTPTVCAKTTFDAQHSVSEWINTGYVPTTIVIDAEGNMIYQMIGAYEDMYLSIMDMLLYAPWQLAPHLFDDPYAQD